MNIVLIDNETILLKELQKLFSAHTVQIYPWDKVEENTINAANLVVLTGSSKYSVIKDAHVYKKQVELLQKTDKPVVGICAGFELIVHSFGGKIIKRKKEIRGLQKFEILRDDKIFNDLNDTNVYEAHHYSAISLSPSLLALAESSDGYEIVKHKNRFIYGFQFHPELQTEGKTGEILINNLLKMLP